MQCDYRQSFIKMYQRPSDVNKLTCGRILIIAGSSALPVSASLNAVSALRSGAGWVVLAVPESIGKSLYSMNMEVKFHLLKESKTDCLSAEAVESVLSTISQYQVVMVGAGLKECKETTYFLIELLSRAAVLKPSLYWVIDAAALKPLYDHCFTLNLHWERQVWLPNEIELKHLFGNILPSNIYERINFIKHIVNKMGMLWIYKGEHSRVLGPNSVFFKNCSGNHGMAVMGMGDVLGGIIAALIAQGMPLWDAVCQGVFLHGYTGDLLYSKQGIGLLPRDMIEMLPQAMKSLYNEYISMEELHVV